MEGVSMKLPSFNSLSPITISVAASISVHRSFSRFRRSVFSATISADSKSLSQDFRILHQVLLTVAEHHSCLVPWKIVSQKTGAILKFVMLNEDEVPDIDKLREMICFK